MKINDVMNLIEESEQRFPVDRWVIRLEAEDAGRQPGVESLPSRRLGRRSRAGFLIC